MDKDRKSAAGAAPSPAPLLAEHDHTMRISSTRSQQRDAERANHWRMVAGLVFTIWFGALVMLAATAYTALQIAEWVRGAGVCGP